MNLYNLKDKHNNSLLEFIQTYYEIFDWSIGKYTGSDYTIELKENAKPFPIPKYSQTSSQEKNLKIN